MKFCHNCGTKLDDAETFCHECGVKVAEENPVATVENTPPQYNSTTNTDKKFYQNPAIIIGAIILLACGVFIFNSKQNAPVSGKNDTYYIDVADRHIDKGDYRSAITAFQKAIELNPKNEAAYFGLGYCYNQLADYQNAIKFYKKYIELDSGYDAAYNNLGNAYRALNDYPTAFTNYQKALALNPNNATVNFSLGCYYSELNDHYNAINFFLKAIELNPQNDVAYYNCGNSYLELGDYEGAIFMYNKSVEVNPQNSQAYYNMAVAYERLERYDDELKYLNKAIELEPNNEFYRTTRENVLYYFFNSQGNGAQSALEQYYNFIASANPRAAFDMLSYDMQNYMNGLDNFSKGHANVSLNRLSNVKTISSSGNSAVLEYRLDSNCWEHGRDVSRAFQGTATLQKIDNRWIITDLRVNAL